MKRCMYVFFLFGMMFSCANQTVLLDQVAVDAPFEMPNIEIPNFSNAPRYSIVDFGAEVNDVDATSQAIEAAIAKAHANKGGVVVIPTGEWLTGKVHLKSYVNLHLEEGAVLRFSGDPQRYLPAVHTSWEGLECYNYSPLIYAYEGTHIAITGKGELKADMQVWRKWFSRPKGHMESLKQLYYMAAYDVPVEDRNMVNDSANFRPQFIQFNRCQHVLMEDVKITNSPFWTIHPYMTKHIVVRGVRIHAHGHNNDGIDPEMTQNMLIEDCVFDQGDDAIAIKAGRNQDAWRLNMPTQNIVIRNSQAVNGHQLVAIGSEMSGGVENVFVENCSVQPGAKLNHLLFIKTNERRGGFVRHIYMKNVTSGRIDLGILGIETDVLYQWRNLVPTIERKLTTIHDIYLEEVHAENVEFVSRILGQEELPVQNVQLKAVVADTIRGEAYRHKNVNQFELQ